MHKAFRMTYMSLICLALSSSAYASGSGTLYAGMYPDDFWNHAQIINDAATWTGKRLTLSGTFMNANEAPDNVMEKLEQAWMAQSTPFANIEVSGNAAAVASGSLDATLLGFATNVKAWLERGEGRSVIIAPMQEMNLAESPWGCDAASFQIAFRKFVSAFGQVGIDDDTKVRWAFAPNGWTSPQCGGQIAPFYPGSDVVDIIGISAYNFGPNEWDGKYRFPAEVYQPFLDQLRGFAPEKPYLIAQTGTAPQGGDRDAWLRDMFAVLSADPNVVAFIYFNKDKSSWGGNEWDWRIFDEGSVSGVAGFVEGMQQSSTTYAWPLSTWFQPGPLPLNP
jgi:beta-mannanase